MGEAKVITMYLPQFHRVKENDEWWGKGFTEWTAVRKAQPLFEGHYQPRKPQKNNYYDLMDKSVMKWQADLMHLYGVDAQCIYHYWFKDGRRILEKPAENLLTWKEIDMPFCFCWANETWARSWSHIVNKNTWADSFEENDKKKDKGILLEQQYGHEQQWREHFEYLCEFFHDKRYLKKDEKPVFVVYKAKLMPCFNKMMQRWKEWAAEEGFPGIYVVAADSGETQRQYMDLALYHEPGHAMSSFMMEHRNKTHSFLNYHTIWKEILEHAGDKNQAYGGFVGYDDTPRRGNQGNVVYDASPEAFREYLSELIAKNMADGNELIFLNAWNEWGEGMYLEPDCRFGDQYLQAIYYAKEHYKGYLEKYVHLDYCKSLIQEQKRLQAKAFRYEKYWRVLDKWLYLKEQDIHIEDGLEEQGIHSVAVYGMGMLGKHLVEELRKGCVQVRYGIDVRGGQIKADIPVYSLCDKLPEADAAIVTVDYDFDTIKEELEKRVPYKILSLAQIIEEL